MTRPTGPAHVWSSTWVAAPPPFGNADVDGFAVVWADLDDGSRVQAVVRGEGGAPPIGSAGTVHEESELEVLVFVPGGSQ